MNKRKLLGASLITVAASMAGIAPAVSTASPHSVVARPPNAPPGGSDVIAEPPTGNPGGGEHVVA